MFKCGSCSQDYYTCDYGSCKRNFAMLRDSSIDDNDCYPNDQNMPNFIYDNTTGYYEKCFHSCKFCSKKESLSTSSEHNCLTCREGYLKSYEYLGNCYKINNIYNNSNYKKIVNNREDESYTIVDNCIGKNIIASTGECVSNCPTSTVFQKYNYIYRNFTQQTYNVMGKMYTLTNEAIPKYKLGNLCYEGCPSLTTTDNTNLLCKCKYSWEQNETTKEITCYSKDYCSSREYYYYNDTKECSLNSCRENYYQFGFECHKDKCPVNTTSISSDPNKCESNLEYCFIDETFMTYCQTKFLSLHKLRFKDTKIYFKWCNQSLDFYGIKTYLYQNICYDNCPEGTIKNDTDETCSCLYKRIYLNNEKTQYECLKESEKCEDKNKIPVIGALICINDLEECLNNNYKIMNNTCYSECPDNTEPKSDNSNFCQCKYTYYNDSNILECHGPTDSCEIKDYPYKNFDNNECFKTKEECKNRGFYVFNNLCHDKCPNNTEIKNNDKICICLYNYFNNSNEFECFNEEENCLSKGYNYTHNETKECFKTKEDCIEKGYKIFNKECYDECPSNTQDKNNNNICECLYYFYNENGIFNCFNSDEICEDRNYMIKNEEYKECFNSIEDCFSKEYLYYYNDTCFKNNCSSDKISLGSLTNNNLKKEIINQLNISDSTTKDGLCICNTFDNKTYFGWINNDSNPSTQICLNECPENYYIDGITNRCFSCDFIINNICYKDGIPENTKFNSSSSNKADNITNISMDESIENKSTDTYISEININYIEYFKKNDKTNNYTTDILIKNALKNKSLAPFILNLIEKENKDIIIEDNNIIYQLTSSHNQINSNSNLSTINFEVCEMKLKEYYNISNNSAILI